jgi:DnaJ family protein A protein 2
MFNGFNSFFGGRGMEEDESQSASQGEVDNKAFYEALGVPQNATGDEIKKAFRKKAMKDHPDKGGDPEKVVYQNISYHK